MTTSGGRWPTRTSIRPTTSHARPHPEDARLLRAHRRDERLLQRGEKEDGAQREKRVQAGAQALEQALSVDVADATDDTTAELHAAEAAFRDQRQQILPLYKQVMDWYR